MDSGTHFVMPAIPCPCHCPRSGQVRSSDNKHHHHIWCPVCVVIKDVPLQILCHTISFQWVFRDSLNRCIKRAKWLKYLLCRSTGRVACVVHCLFILYVDHLKILLTIYMYKSKLFYHILFSLWYLIDLWTPFFINICYLYSCLINEWNEGMNINGHLRSGTGQWSENFRSYGM